MNGGSAAEWTWSELMPGLAAALFAAVHILTQKLRFLDVIPRSRWLSAAGGASVAYVFIHLLPELSRSQKDLEQSLPAVMRFLERHVYIAALLGAVVFYGLEHVVRQSRAERRETGGPDKSEVGVFVLHIAAFSAYNVLIGYLLLHRFDRGAAGFLTFTAAFAVHLVVNDYGLLTDHKDHYSRHGRWVLAAAVMGGYLLGLEFTVDRAVTALALAFLVGGVILNVFREELPEERRSSFVAFAGGAVAYGVLLLLA
mgnify:CR=1 FL=1